MFKISRREKSKLIIRLVEIVKQLHKLSKQLEDVQPRENSKITAGENWSPRPVNQLEQQPRHGG